MSENEVIHIKSSWNFQDWMVVLQAIVSLLQQLFPTQPPALGAEVPKTRNPVQEEKVRLVIITACQLWALLATDPVTKSKLLNVVATCSDPAKWETLANLFWGP